MRPHEPTARTKASGLARARMHLRSKLGFMCGFPDGPSWTVVPDEGDREVEQLRLDRNHLRRATSTTCCPTPACHDRDRGFVQHSTRLVRSIAETMGTVLVTRGTVPTLVASSWYDDGPVDIAGCFDPLAESSEFRRALADVCVDALPDLLSRTFGRSQIDEGIAPMLLALPELDARPELAVALLLLVRHPERLPLRTCLAAGQRLAQVGADERARDLFAEPMARALWQQHREHQWMDPTVLEYLAQVDPSRALRLLRQTRARGVRRWSDESASARLFVAGIAMEGLRRPKQALRMYRLAEHARDPHGLQSEARARRRALESDSAT